jgi:uncharacterized protein
MKCHRFTLIAVVCAMILSLSTSAYAGKFMTMHSGSPGGSAYQVGTGLSNLAHKYAKGDITIQVTSGKAVPRSLLAAGKGKVDFYNTTPLINTWLANGQRMFKKLKNPKELHANLRAVFVYPIGAYQFVVYENSGIKTFADLKGKKVFLGPKTGAARVISESTIQAVSGLKPNVDYTGITLDWRTSRTSFRDRQLDAIMTLGAIPSPLVSEWALTNKIRLIGIPASSMKNPLIAKMLKMPGRTIEVIAPDTYGKNQMNEKPVNALGMWVTLGTHAGVDDESVYQVTKAFWEHIDEFYAVAEWTKKVNRDTAFTSLDLPLHKGAYRYYKEAGFNIPTHNLPRD